MELKELFAKHQIPQGETMFFSSGTFTLGVKNDKDGWFIKKIGAEDSVSFNEEEVLDGDYFKTGKSNQLIFFPALPERSLVFKGSRLHVAQGQKLTFFLKIPLILQVYTSSQNPENLLTEITVRRMSDTWIGEPDNGEMALAYDGDHYLQFNSIQPQVTEAICPISIVNNSPAPLEVQRLIIKTENMNLYVNQGKKVTSLLEIEYKEPDAPVSADYRYSKPIHGEKQEIIAKARNSNSKSLLKINFSFIKNI